ncbi:MAG: serine hydrolase [Bacteroidales bacterium]|nr:serine hydrolase [Bacteroidales bacterium]
MLISILFSLTTYLWTVNFDLAKTNPILAMLYDNYGVKGQLETRVAEVAREAGRNFLPLQAAARPVDNFAANHLPAARDKASLIPTRATSTDYKLATENGVVIDSATGAVLFQKNSDRVRPIASITKLMTALVFLEHNPGWELVYQIREEDRREGSKAYFAVGEKVKVKDLFYLSLVASGNTETVALVNSAGLGLEAFVKKMNDKAVELGLANTAFKDPVGLDNGNVSTALEVAKLAQAAFAISDIRQASITKKHEFTTLTGNKITVENTDKLLDRFASDSQLKIIGGKTGYTDEAGGSLASKFNNQAGKEIISVVLGGADRSSRFSETRGLVEWIYENYRWPD